MPGIVTIRLRFSSFFAKNPVLNEKKVFSKYFEFYLHRQAKLL